MQKAFKEIIEKVKLKYEDVNPYVSRAVVGIVNQVAEEYKINDGWIPCSVKMPNEPEIGMLDIECLQEYNVMIEGVDAATTLYYAGDGEWYDFITGAFYKVIAWQPLPLYQPKICINTDCCYNQKSECPASAGCPGYEGKTTNADVIRSMSDEELAELIPVIIGNCCNPNEECTETILNHGECEKTKECALKWLKSESEIG